MCDKPVKREEAPPPYSEKDLPPPYSKIDQTQNSIITDAVGLPVEKQVSPAWQPSNIQKPGDYQNGRSSTPSVSSPGLGGSNPGPYSAPYGSSGYSSPSYSTPRSSSSSSFIPSSFYHPAFMNLWAYTQPSSYRTSSSRSRQRSRQRLHSSNSSQRLQNSGYLRAYLAVLLCSFLIGMLS